jgi:hypothetical protein
MLNRLRREPYFPATRVPDLTTPCTKSHDFWWYGILVTHKYHCKKIAWNVKVHGVKRESTRSET